MKNKLLITLFAVGFMAFVGQVEAKHHSRMHVNVGVSKARPAYVVNQPVVVAPAPVVVQPAPVVATYPTYYAPPTYVVQPQPVIVAQPAPRSFFDWGFANFGFSFGL